MNKQEFHITAEELHIFKDMIESSIKSRVRLLVLAYASMRFKIFNNNFELTFLCNCNDQTFSILLNLTICAVDNLQCRLFTDVQSLCAKL